MIYKSHLGVKELKMGRDFSINEVCSRKTTSTAWGSKCNDFFLFESSSRIPWKSAER